MSDKELIAKVATYVVVGWIILTVVPDVISAMFYPSTGTLSTAVESVAVNWWVPIAKASPVLFLIVVFVFNEVGVEDLFEL